MRRRSPPPPAATSARRRWRVVFRGRRPRSAPPLSAHPLLPLEKLGPAPREALVDGEHEKNNLPDCLTRWCQRKESERDRERERERTAQSVCVPKDEIAAQGYDLSLNRYKELVQEEVEHRPLLEILAELRAIEQEILQGIEALEGMWR